MIPREGSSCSLRYALYRMMVQGFRRCQASTAGTLTVGGLTEHSREFFSGLPIWRYGGVSRKEHPGGYTRVVDEDTGALKWVHEDDPVDVWETMAFW